MHELFIGILVSLAVTELTGYSPGGIVVAGYLALFAAQPAWLVSTGMAAIATYLFVKLLERRLLLFGRRLFAFYVLVGLLISQAAISLSRGEYGLNWGIVVIGYLVPGLIARDFGRQGIIPTILATALSVVLTCLIYWAGDGLVW